MTSESQLRRGLLAFLVVSFLFGGALLALGCSSKAALQVCGDGGSAAAGPSGGAGKVGAGSAGSAGETGVAGSGRGGGTGVAGAAGSGGAGSGGAGGTGVAGTMGIAGTRGTAGTTASAGTTGAAGTSATAGTTGAAGIASDSAQSVLTRGKHNSRDGFFIQPTLTRAAAHRMAMDVGFAPSYTGRIYGSPLYVENGPGGKGAFYAATNNNDIYAFDETSGTTVWTHNIGVAPQQSGAGCGNVHPIGIISTPVIDATTRTIYVAGAVGQTYIERHEIHALSIDSGAERPGWPVNVSALTGPGGLVFNTKAQNQRAALSLVNGTLYVPYGGHSGDCNVYHGWIVAVNTANPAQVGTWATAGPGEAIWAPGGMVSDGNGIMAVTGNRTLDSATHQDGEEVVRVTGMGTVDRSTGVFFPASWRTMDQKDMDLGASNPVLLSVPGGTPSTVLAATAKDGHIYLLDPANLGGMGGHLHDLPLTTGNSIRTAVAGYTSTTGAHLVLNTVSGADCGLGQGIVSLLVSPGSPPTSKEAWCMNTTGFTPAIATSTDGKNDTIVWFMSSGTLRGLDGDDATTIYLDLATTCNGALTMTSPIAVKGRIIVAVDGGHFCSWSPHL